MLPGPNILVSEMTRMKLANMFYIRTKDNLMTSVI